MNNMLSKCPRIHIRAHAEIQKTPEDLFESPVCYHMKSSLSRGSSQDKKTNLCLMSTTSEQCERHSPERCPVECTVLYVFNALIKG